jgi:uncharacterized protein YraI
MKKLFAALLTAGLLAGSGPALADTARASANISIHRGPGIDYPVIGTLRKDARVELRRCTNRGVWCLFEDRNGRAVGWVRGSYLIGIGAITRASPFHFLVNPDIDDLINP